MAIGSTYQPARLTAEQMEKLLSTLRTSPHQSDRDIAAEIDGYRSVTRKAA